MDEKYLQGILTKYYGIEDRSLEFLREGGTHTYIVSGSPKYLLKVIGSAFSDTAKQSVSIMRYLEENGFPVPGTILTKSGESILETEIEDEKKLIVLMEFIDGDEPELEKCASEVGELVGRFHRLMEKYPAELTLHGKEFFIDRYLNFLRKKNYPRITEYEELGERLWEKVKDLPIGSCHGDLHRGNLLQNPDGKIYLVDFDTACRAPFMFDVMVMCDMTDYFHLKQKDIKLTGEVYKKFLSGYSDYHTLSREEILSFPYWVAIRHFQLQATILEIYGPDCIDEGFIDGQLYWLNKWQEAIEKQLLITSFQETKTLYKNDYTIRLEKSEDYRTVETLVRESFWNVYRPGCSEHYVIHVLRDDPAFVKELDFVMEQDGKLIGQNMFMKTIIEADDGRKIPVLTMGPIGITPELKRKGYGKAILDYSLEKATEMGFGAVLFEGNIGFYGKSGFDYASKFGIRYHDLPEDADSSFFLCKELIPGYLDGVTGIYQTPQGYYVDDADVDKFDKEFPPKEKLKLPGQIFG